MELIAFFKELLLSIFPSVNRFPAVAFICYCQHLFFFPTVNLVFEQGLRNVDEIKMQRQRMF
jgi:hypothetical protein